MVFYKILYKDPVGFYRILSDPLGSYRMSTSPCSFVLGPTLSLQMLVLIIYQDRAWTLLGLTQTSLVLVKNLTKALIKNFLRLYTDLTGTSLSPRDSLGPCMRPASEHKASESTPRLPHDKHQCDCRRLMQVSSRWSASQLQAT